MAQHSRCAWHGCGVKSKDCEFHHLEGWSKGGRTDLDNLRPLCRRHHRMVHDGGWKAVLGVDGQLVLIPPDGRPPLRAVPEVRARTGDKVVAANRAAGGVGGVADDAGDTIRGQAGGEAMSNWAHVIYLDHLVAIDERAGRLRPVGVPN